MGLSAYGTGDYSAAVKYFREVLSEYPLNEVYNNLGAAESESNPFAGMQDIQRAWDADPNDATYSFNLGLALLKNKNPSEAAKRFNAVLERDPDDSEARLLADRTPNGEDSSLKLPHMRLKENFDETAFRELKAMLQPHGSK